MDIKTIPIEVLKKDKQESIEDIAICKIALEKGIKKYSRVSVQERLNTNKRILQKIEDELTRREK